MRETTQAIVQQHTSPRVKKCTLKTKPKKLAPNVNIPVRSPRTGVSTVPFARKLGVEEIAVLEVRIGVATRTRGAGGG